MCDFQDFSKFMCKHVIGMAIRLNYCQLLPAAKQVHIGCVLVQRNQKKHH